MADEDRQRKAYYIIENAADDGYDTSKFNKWVEDRKKGKIESMDYSQLVQAVADYNKFKLASTKLQIVKKYQNLRLSDEVLEDSGVPESADLSMQIIEADAAVEMVSSESLINQSLMQPEKTMETKKAFQVRNELYGRQVTVEVVDPEVVKTGLFKSTDVLFTVQVSIEGLGSGGGRQTRIQRKDVDFYALRRVLVQMYPYILVPPLPPIQTSTKEKDLLERVQAYTRFLRKVVRSEILKTCKFLFQFLTVEDYKYWKVEREGYEKVKFSRRVEDVVSESGHVCVEERSDSQKFCDESKTFQDIYRHITKEAITLSKEVDEMSQNLGHSVNRLALCLKDLAKLYRRLKIPSQSKLFSRLSDLFKDTSVNFQHQGNLTKIYCGQAMKVYELEHQPLDEMVAFRDQFRSDYFKFARDLDERKNMLFKQDVSQWGYTRGPLQDLQVRSSELCRDKQKAFKYMLTEETQRQTEMAEELNYYTNQVLDETRRVGRCNGETLIEHFMDQGKIQCEYLQQQFDKWSEFVAYFGSMAWDTVEAEPKKNRKKQPRAIDDFELIDDLNKTVIENNKVTPQIQQLDDAFELVSNNKKSDVRTMAIKLEEKQTVPTPTNMRSTGGGARKTALLSNQEIANSLSKPTSDGHKSSGGNQNSTDSTGQEETKSQTLFQPPTIVLKKGRQSNAHRTAPIGQQPQPKQESDVTQNRNTQPIDQSEQQLSNDSGSAPIFGNSGSGSGKIEQRPPLPVQDPAHAASHSSGENQQATSHKSNYFNFNTDMHFAQHDIIPEESENPSSEEPTLRGNDTFVVTDVNDFAQVDILGNRSGTLSTQPEKPSIMRPPQREQTITSAPQSGDFDFNFKEPIKAEPVTQQTLKPTREAAQEQSPKKLEIPNAFLGQVKLKPVPQLQKKPQPKPDESLIVSKILSRSKMSILTQNQIQDLSSTKDNDLASVNNLEAEAETQSQGKTNEAKPQEKQDKPGQKKVIQSEIQKAIRRLQMSANDSSDDE